MSVTDELRRLMDERGVKHEDEDTPLDTHGTLYRVTTTADWVYEEPPECDLLVRSRYDIGAEEAIEVEATLGRGVCKDVAETPKFSDKTRFECSACGYEYSAVGGFGCDYGDAPDFNYCPNCGREVES